VSALTLAGLGLLGGAGALARFALDAAITRRAGRDLPVGTLAVNVTGAFALGVLVGTSLGADQLRLAGAGLLGSYTTFSTWALESHRLGEDGRRGAGALNFAISLGSGLAAAWAGRRLGILL
jgi:CrcB protein